MKIIFFSSKAYLGFIIFILFASIALPALSQAQEIGKVTYATGSVHALLDGITRTLKRRSDLFTRDEIETGSKSSANLRFSDSSIINLDANTTFIIKKYLYTQAKKAKGRGKDTFTGRLLRGKLSTVTAGIARLNEENYSMEVGRRGQKPIAIIGVRGTYYTVSYDPITNIIKLSVLRGRVTVNNVRLRAGERLNFNASTHQTSVRCRGGAIRRVK